MAADRELLSIISSHGKEASVAPSGELKGALFTTENPDGVKAWKAGSSDNGRDKSHHTGKV